MPLDDGVRLRIRVIGSFVEEVRTEDRKRCAVLLPREYLMPVLELVVTDRHRVVTHREHQLESESAFGEFGESACKDVAGIEQEYVRLRLTDAVDERRHLGDAADHLLIVEPECGNRVVCALDVVCEEQGDRDRFPGIVSERSAVDDEE